jgi:nucleotide-binding universal stress UspA family protein
MNASDATLKLDKILVPVDFSNCSTQALDYALAFAAPFNASLILLHVVEPAVPPDDYLAVASAMNKTNENLVRAGRERLEELAREKLRGQVSCQTLVRIGRAHSEIADTANALGADIIIMGTHGRTGFHHALLGSTAERVIRHASCPVLTVRQGVASQAGHAPAGGGNRSEP